MNAFLKVSSVLNYALANTKPATACLFPATRSRFTSHSVMCSDSLQFKLFPLQSKLYLLNVQYVSHHYFPSQKS